MTPRANESAEDYKARRAAYDLGRGWRARQRTRDKDGVVKSVTEVRRGRNPKRVPQVGIPSATSTLYDSEGRVAAQWIKTRPEHQTAEHVCRILADELAKPLPRAPLVYQMEGGQISDKLMAVYPVGDHHLGMLAWRPETGTSYDIEIGERMLGKAFDRLIPLTPRCEQAAILFLGDFMHYDSREPLTPTSKHHLDADSRWQKMVRAALRCMRRQIEAAAGWHQHLTVIVEPGNHDPFSSIFLAEALANIYDLNDRITVDTTPRPYHYLRFGSVLLGTHHGDLAKPEALPGIMAADRPEEWGITTHRYWYTGHIHSRQAQDFRGCSWESFRILPPADAWAAHKGYRPIRDQKAIIHHVDHGEVARHTVNPAMLDEA